MPCGFLPNEVNVVDPGVQPVTFGSSVETGWCRRVLLGVLAGIGLGGTLPHGFDPHAHGFVPVYGGPLHYGMLERVGLCRR